MAIHDHARTSGAEPTDLPRQLRGGTVPVTGSGRGLGQVISSECASAGARVIGTARSETTADATYDYSTANGGSSQTGFVDLTNSAAVTTLAADVIEECRAIDVLVNNSGVPGPRQPTLALSDAACDDVTDVNLTGVLRCWGAFLPQMITNRGGSVVTIGLASARTGLLNRVPCAASKAAIAGLTQTWTLEVGPHDVHVNVVTPGESTATESSTSSTVRRR